MKKLIQVIFIIFTNLGLSFSQNTSHLISENFSLEKKQEYLPNEGNLYISPNRNSISIYDKKTLIDYLSDDENIYSLHGKTISTYNKKTLKNKKEIRITNFPENQKKIKCIKFHGEYIMFFSSILKKSSTVVKFYFRKLNISTGELGKENFIFEVDNDRSELYKNGIPHLYFIPMPEFQLSKDNSKLLFSCNQHFHVFEKNMQLKWKTEKVYGEKTPDIYDLQDMLLGNDGSLHLIIKIFKEDLKSDDPHSELSSSEKKEPNYDIKAFKVDENGSSKIPIEVLKNRLIHSLTLHKDSNNKLLCLGLYFNDSNLDYSLGFFAVSLEDPNTEFISYPISSEVPIFYSKYSAMGNSTYIQVKNKDKIPSEKKGIRYLHGLEIKNTKDGHLMLITEQHIGFNPSKEIRRGMGNYAHILVTKINLNGDIIWAKRLTKFQIGNVSTTSGDGYGCGSYKYLYLNDKHYLIYLDDKKNQNLNLEVSGKYCTSCRSGNIFAYILDDNGTVAKDFLFDFDKKSSDTQFDFKHHMVKISNSEFLFHLFPKKNTYGIVKIKTQ